MLTVEIDNPRNCNHMFPPLQRTLRGRLDWNRDQRPHARANGDQMGVIPGQRIMIGGNKATIHEPLRDDDYEVQREKIEAMGYTLAKDETFDDIDANTWHFWLQRAVDAGHAKVIDGKLPRADAGKATKDFIHTKPTNPIDKLSEAIERQTEALTKLLEGLAGVQK